MAISSFRGIPPEKFRKQMIAAESAESVGVFDVHGDHILALISGSYWYDGPLFLKRQFIGQVIRVGEYFDDFSTIPLDVNMDFITGGWFNERCCGGKTQGIIRKGYNMKLHQLVI